MASLNFFVWNILPWCVVALWMVYLTLLIAGLNKRQVLHASTPVNDLRGMPRVSVLVAARNEQSCIETCLRSLVQQDYLNLEVIAIDDRSTDATGEILDRLEGEFPDVLKIVHVESLPAGWFGKTHAMHQGTQVATGEWLCHVDADCEVLSRSAIALAVQEAQRRGADLLSLTPQFVLNTVWEHITVPMCSSLMMIWFQPARVNNPRLSTSYANGAFLMMTRRCLDAVGGWCRFRAQISEDIAVAREVKSSGMRLVVLQNDGIYRTRMYETIRDSWNGWSRIFYGALPRKALILSLIRLVLCSIIPTWGLFAWLVAAPFQGMTWSPAIVAAAMAVVIQQIYSALIYRAVSGKSFWSLATPLSHLVLLGILCRALLNHVGLATTQWSGAVFRRGQLVSVPRPKVSLSAQTTRTE